MPPVGFALSPSLSLAKWLDYIPKARPKGLSLIGPLLYAWLKLQGLTIKTPIKIQYLVTMTSLSNQDWVTHPSTHFPSFPLETAFADCIHLIRGQSTPSTCPAQVINLPCAEHLVFGCVLCQLRPSYRNCNHNILYEKQIYFQLITNKNKVNQIFYRGQF